MELFDKLIALTLPFVPKPLVGKFAAPYIAGDSLDDAARVLKELNRAGCCATLDLLGEFITKKEQCEEAVKEYLNALDRIEAEQLDSNISVKLTMLGLKLDRDYCLMNMRRLVERARELGNFVRIDIEDSSCTTDTLHIYSTLKRQYDNVGCAVQAYMRRSLADIEALINEHAKINVRICKGIYIETRDVAYKDMSIINSNYNLMVDTAIRKGSYVGVATHDEKLVWAMYKLIHERGLRKDQFEFQMLLGVDLQLRDLILKEGYKLRVYVPYGKEWYAYSTRRLKENPTIAKYVLRSILGLGG